jgi:hypothetical protein
MLRPIAVWVLVVGCGLGLLYARFDWSVEDGRFAERGWLLSAYLFAILLPTVYYGACRLLRDRVAAGLLTGLVFLVTTLPWRLLGLDRFDYYADRPRYFRVDQIEGPNAIPTLQFLPEGVLRSFPFDWLFMPLLFAFGVACIWGLWWVRERAAAAPSRVVPLLLTAAFAAICVQGYLHTSMRSPYTYVPHFKEPEEKQYWYLNYHFKDATGAVNADQFVFSALEEYFAGAPYDENNMLVRRPLSFYLAAQVSYFVNTFYVWLGLNALFWLAAVAATGRWVGIVANPRAGVIAGALVTFSPGFVAFFGVPGMYLHSFTVAMIALWAFEELIVRGRRTTADFALFAGVMTLSMLVYDLLPVLASLLVYGLARGVRAAPLVAALASAFVFSRVFTLLVTGVLDIEIVPTNAQQLDEGIEAVRELVTHPSLPVYYKWFVDLVPGFVQRMLQAFFVVPTLLAVVALPLVKDAALRWLTATLAVTWFAVVVVFVLGGQTVGDAPRLLFPMFPVVYLLAAVALDRFRLPGALRAASPWIVVAVMAILVNVDIFGYMTLHYEFQYGHPPVFVP